MRKLQGLTIEMLKEKTSVDVGQISRLEAGRFVFVSENLQKLMTFLESNNAPKERHPHLVHRFTELLDRSPRHQAAALALVNALERLQ